MLFEELTYDPDTGVVYRDGKEAGWSTERGNRQLEYSGIRYHTHHIAWYLHYGEWPQGEIDHVNQDPSDNRITNLRVVSRSQNMRNQNKIKGYHKCNGKYRSQYSLDGKVYHIGMYDTPEEARTAYIQATEGK